MSEFVDPPWHGETFVWSGDNPEHKKSQEEFVSDCMTSGSGEQECSEYEDIEWRDSFRGVEHKGLVEVGDTLDELGLWSTDTKSSPGLAEWSNIKDSDTPKSQGTL